MAAMQIEDGSGSDSPETKIRGQFLTLHLAVDGRIQGKDKGVSIFRRVAEHLLAFP